MIIINYYLYRKTFNTFQNTRCVRRRGPMQGTFEWPNQYGLAIIMKWEMRQGEKVNRVTPGFLSLKTGVYGNLFKSNLKRNTFLLMREKMKLSFRSI